MNLQIDINLSELAESAKESAGVDLHLDQYFGLWAVDDVKFHAMLRQIAAMDLQAHIEASAASGNPTVPASPGEDAIAVIEISGVITKRGSSFSLYGSTIYARKQIRAAASDPSIKGIILRMDTPGGTVSGVHDLALDVRRARQQKPIYTFAEDFVASAGYWIASQATKVYGNNRTASVGSIGTYVGLYDYSKWAEKHGIRAVVIKAGQFKGAGFPGTQITDEQIEEWQTLVDKTQAEFSRAVAIGRGMKLEQVSRLADGRVHMAADAARLGLIDGIKSFDACLEAIREESRRFTVEGNRMGKRRLFGLFAQDDEEEVQDDEEVQEDEETMDDEDEEPEDEEEVQEEEESEGEDEEEAEGDDEAQDEEESKKKSRGKRASVAALERALPRASAAFLLGQYRRRATVAQAQSAYIRKLESRVKKGKGAKALATGATRHAASSSGAEAFSQLVNRHTKGGMSRADAVRAAVTARPDLHRAFLMATNNRPAAQRLLRDKFAGV